MIEDSIEEEIIVKRKKPSALPGIMSLAVVMFLLGLLALSFVGFEGFSRILREGSGIDVYFKDSVAENEIKTWQKKIEGEKWCLRTQFISREQGFEEFKKNLDPEIASFAEAQSLPNSVSIFFKAEFADLENIANTARKMESNPIIEDVDYNPESLKKTGRTVHQMQWIFAGLAFLFMLIAISIISNSIRLGIFANRFIIKSMQLVGATNSYITWPFVKKYLWYVIAALPIAALFLLGCLYAIPFLLPIPFKPHDYLQYVNPYIAAVLGLAIVIFGTILTVLCTLFSTRKYLRSKIENLY